MSATVQDIQTGGPSLPPVGAPVLARLWNVPESEVAKLASSGIIDKIGRGKFDLLKATSAYIRYLQGISSDAVKDPDKMEPKARLDWYKGNQARRADALEAGEVVYADDVRDAMASLIKNLMLTLDTLTEVVEREAQLTPEQSGAVQRIIDRERRTLHAALTASGPVE